MQKQLADQLGVASPTEGALDGCETYTNEMNSLADGETETSSILQTDHSQVMLNLSSRHRPLSPLRILRGICCLVVLLSTAFMMLVCLSPVAYVLPRLFSVRCSRRMTSFFFSKWLSLWPFLFEKINKTKVVWSGEIVPPGERVLLLCNHRTEVDWMYLWNFAIRKGRLGYIKYILKNSLMKLPIFGWGFHIFDFIPVERKWEHDELLIREMLSTFLDPLDPLWLIVFPEGTDYTEQKCLRSQQHAKENGLPILKHVLLPKTKGFSVCTELLRNSLDKVYDVTIGYKHRCPSFMDNVFGVEPSEVHIHVRHFPLQAIPTSESEAADWLLNLFQQKDSLLSDFHSKGHFPNQTVEVDLSVPRCLVNFAFVIIVTTVCTFLTCLSPWFKLYVVLSCSYLTSATYFNIRPVPLFGGKNWTS
ncbi:probable 1-acyl-sn-glycerol-3-phosphate acyltransferase 5 isoform X1 [Nymphaea colorata]|nr:probable 1-acyl-sn-glycerol-3-phosphate acyltransferase 5 isoform X1 [Nymphaea colorata]XP_031479554.1 probable 1-acyl-sn-glycerol-3-phosphate acyltransferase 5 isoform X1 [Nymphaea colorata]XP_031479555.1 probable 1-acyl-sn-glycerol-3-phosphate acyltransferase 5 isoform X1 [Nymphaea colorata]